MQVGQPFVEFVGIIGGAVVAPLKALGKIQLQACLEAEHDIAETHRHRPGIDHEHRDGQQLSLDPVDPSRVDRTGGDDNLKPASRRHRRGAVRNDDPLRRIAATNRYGDEFLSRNAAPIQALPRRRLWYIAAYLRRLTCDFKKDRVIQSGLGDVVAPAHPRLQLLGMTRQQHGQSDGRRLERARRR